MRKGDFEGPPIGRSILSVAGGLVTAIALIFGLELSAKQLLENPPPLFETYKTASPTSANPL